MSFFFLQVTPAYFAQTYLICGVLNSETIPLVAAVMSNRGQEDYEKVFRLLAAAGVDPAHSFTDNEAAVLVALKAVWPNIQVSIGFKVRPKTIFSFIRANFTWGSASGIRWRR